MLSVLFSVPPIFQMNKMQFSDGHGSRPTSFFIEDILLNKPKPTFRELPSLPVRPTVSDFPGYPYFPGLFYPHQVLQQTQSFLHKHPEHPFLMPSVAGEYILFFSFCFLSYSLLNAQFYSGLNFNIALQTNSRTKCLQLKSLTLKIIEITINSDVVIFLDTIFKDHFWYY